MDAPARRRNGTGPGTRTGKPRTRTPRTGLPRTGAPGTAAPPSRRLTRPSTAAPPRHRTAGTGGATGRDSRTPFVFLVVGLLGGGLICLLLINTMLASGAFQITSLQRGNVSLAQQGQELQAQIAAEESPAVLARQARRLGMVEPPLLHFINLQTGRVTSEPRHARGVIPTIVPPGYTP